MMPATKAKMMAFTVMLLLIFLPSTILSHAIRDSPCESDADCRYSEQCMNKMCQDPCKYMKCYEGALCKVRNHEPVCVFGNQKFCKSNERCTPDMTCILGRCTDPCTVTECPSDDNCIVVQHQALCQHRGTVVNKPNTCRRNEDCALDKECTGWTCTDPCSVVLCANGCKVKNHEFYCVEKKGDNDECKSDEGCKPEMACIKGKCIDPCTVNECLPVDNCIVKYHQTFCTPTVPNIHELPTCRKNEDCELKKACIQGNCINPCSIPDCPNGCRVVKHRFQCIKGGEPTIVNPNTCQRNEDCEPQKACIQGDCMDPCRVANCPYGCTVVNHLFYCIKHRGPLIYACQRNEDCEPQKACIQGDCMDPCSIANCPYGCTVVNHMFSCINYRGGCTSNDNCDATKACYSGKCVDPCLSTNCKGVCVVGNHKAFCIASSHRGPCRSNNNCEVDKTCLSGECVNPCALIYCNDGCAVQNHGAFCLG